MSNHESYDQFRDAVEAAWDGMKDQENACQFVTGLTFTEEPDETRIDTAQYVQSPLPSIKGHVPDRIKERTKRLK